MAAISKSEFRQLFAETLEENRNGVALILESSFELVAHKTG